MKRLILAAAMSAPLAAFPLPDTAHAGHHGVAVGLIGGLAAGTIIGSALAQPRYYYEPVPVVVEPPPAMVEDCYWTRGAPVWDPYRGIWRRPRVQVCD
jgi:hypothetical protein